MILIYVYLMLPILSCFCTKYTFVCRWVRYTGLRVAANLVVGTGFGSQLMSHNVLVCLVQFLLNLKCKSVWDLLGCCFADFLSCWLARNIVSRFGIDFPFVSI